MMILQGPQMIWILNLYTFLKLVFFSFQIKRENTVYIDSFFLYTATSPPPYLSFAFNGPKSVKAY